ncbi:hypothetical protein NUM_52620 [Actinocatenispora comari]|uniref:Uncharacterized protein n=1 Tax=Actinocatenispora comari TaxID=2807577 RepID=A0A8J4ENN2_9ACTN|nr:hypothetical protein NUM_52620 [Actinocatenispora comari]
MRLSYHNPTPTGTPEARDTSIISVRKPGGRARARSAARWSTDARGGRGRRPSVTGTTRPGPSADLPARGGRRQGVVSTVDIQDSTSAAVRGSACDSSW